MAKIIRKDDNDVLVDDDGVEHIIGYVRDPSMDTEGHKAYKLVIPTLKPKEKTEE